MNVIKRKIVVYATNTELANDVDKEILIMYGFVTTIVFSFVFFLQLEVGIRIFTIAIVLFRILYFLYIYCRMGN